MTAEAPTMTRARAIGNPAWTGFVGTLVAQLKGTYREPAAIIFTLAQPLVLLLILDTFNFSFTLPNGETRPYLDRLLPGMIAFMGMTVGLNSVAFALARDKARGTLRRLAATPLPTTSFVAGVIVARLVLASTTTLVAFLAGVFLFGANIEGNGLLVVGLGVLGSVAFIPIGILIVAVARSEEDIPPLTFLPLIVSVMFSGAFLDRSGLPDWLHWITGKLPLTLLTEAVQKVGNLGAGVEDILPQLGGLALWGLGAAVLAGFRFRMS